MVLKHSCNFILFSFLAVDFTGSYTVFSLEGFRIRISRAHQCVLNVTNQGVNEYPVTHSITSCDGKSSVLALPCYKASVTVTLI